MTERLGQSVSDVDGAVDRENVDGAVTYALANLVILNVDMHCALGENGVVGEGYTRSVVFVYNGAFLISISLIDRISSRRGCRNVLIIRSVSFSLL